MIRSALTFARKGISIFPCWPWTKRPACDHGCLDATKDPDRIREWWNAEPDYNIGIATGRPSGIFVLDVDGPDAEAELKKLEKAHGMPLPETVEVITGKGRHCYFKLPDADVRNSAGTIGAGLDIRGSGGFVIAPPSVHPSGRKYCWSVDSAHAVAAAPGWIRMVSAPTNCNGRIPSTDWGALLAKGVDEGARDDTLTKIAGFLLRHCLAADVVLGLLDGWNQTHCRPPLPSRDIERIVRSISKKEDMRRKGAPSWPTTTIS